MKNKNVILLLTIVIFLSCLILVLITKVYQPHDIDVKIARVGEIIAFGKKYVWFNFDFESPNEILRDNIFIVMKPQLDDNKLNFRAINKVNYSDHSKEDKRDFFTPSLFLVPVTFFEKRSVVITIGKAQKPVYEINILDEKLNIKMLDNN